MDYIKGIIQFPGYSGIGGSNTPTSGPTSPVFWVLYVLLLLLNILVSLFYGSRLGGVLWHNLPVFLSLLPEYVEMIVRILSLSQ